MKTIPVRFPQKKQMEKKTQSHSPQTESQNQCQRQPLQAGKVKRPRTKLEVTKSQRRAKASCRSAVGMGTRENVHEHT